MSNETEELVARVDELAQIANTPEYSFLSDGRAKLINDYEHLCGELSQRLHAAEENYDIAAKMLRICENDYKERLKAAEAMCEELGKAAKARSATLRQVVKRPPR